MPYLQVNGAKLAYTEEGSGAETLIFGHGLAFNGHMFAAQVAAFRNKYRCITFDLRGHGESELTATGFDIETFTADTSALVEALGGAPCHFVGWSIGGFTGLRIAIRRPELFRSLTIIGSGAVDTKDIDFGFKMVPFMARTFGMRFINGSLMKSMFSPQFLKDPGRAALKEEWRTRFLANNPLGISRTATAVIEQASIEEKLPQIRLPVLVIRGDLDKVVPQKIAQRTMNKLQNARFVGIPNTGHACNIEEPQAVNNALAKFLAETA